jgi:hypothetical protein
VSRTWQSAMRRAEGTTSHAKAPCTTRACARKATLTRRGRVAHTPRPSHARATQGPYRGRIAPWPGQGTARGHHGRASRAPAAHRRHASRAPGHGPRGTGRGAARGRHGCAAPGPDRAIARAQGQGNGAGAGTSSRAARWAGSGAGWARPSHTPWPGRPSAPGTPRPRRDGPRRGGCAMAATTRRGRAAPASHWGRGQARRRAPRRARRRGEQGREEVGASHARPGGRHGRTASRRAAPLRATGADGAGERRRRGGASPRRCGRGGRELEGRRDRVAGKAPACAGKGGGRG